MKIYSWNVNGIRAVISKGKWDEFITKESPDIICLQEIKAKDHQIELPKDGYEEYFNPADRPGYSGTAILTKVKPLSVIKNLPKDIQEKYLKDDGYGHPNKEGRVLTLEFEKFYLSTVYTPNAKDDLERLDLRYKEWDPAYLEFVSRLQKDKPVIFCGDLNTAYNEDDLANPKANKGKKGFTLEEREGLDNFYKAGFIDTFRQFTEGNGHYTWWSYFAKARERNVGWRIDYFLISKSLKEKLRDARIHADITGSDHCPVSIDIDL